MPTDEADEAANAASADEAMAIELLTRTPYGRIATSMRALPFLAIARHIVVNGRVLLRMHRGYNYHQACDGSVVAYSADNLNIGGRDVVAVQFVGTAEIVEPTEVELILFGPIPRAANEAPFDPVYLRIEPQFITAQRIAGISSYALQHSV